MSTGKKSEKKVLVFGVYDGLYEGHRDFLSQAKGLGEYLVVVVGREETRDNGGEVATELITELIQ